MSETAHAKILHSPPAHVHLLGICGSGMSGLAHLLARAGYIVSGSDIAAGASEMQKLCAAGIRACAGHRSDFSNYPALAIYSSAIRPDNPELVALKKAGVTAVRRGDFLASWTNKYASIAVAGTHGKTTTTAMIAHILRRAGAAPSFYVGADVPILGGKSALGSGPWFVLEADESDGTLASYAPRIGVILNVEEEHLDYFSDLDAILTVFAKFASNTRDKVFYCSDAPGAVRVCSGLRHSVSFGLQGGATYGAVDIRLAGTRSSFTVTHHGQSIGAVSLRIPGEHYVSNALGATAVALEVGVPFGQIAEALAEFDGAKRRFEKKFEGGGILVVDDYAHHPSEVRATIASARQLGQKRVVAAFQPHRYSRTKWLAHQFASAFAMADKLFLTDVYAASEKPIPGVSGRTIFDAVRATGQRNVEYEPSLEKLAGRLAAEARAGDIVLVMGAGSITQVAEDLARELERKFSERVRKPTSACAPKHIEVASATVTTFDGTDIAQRFQVSLTGIALPTRSVLQDLRRLFTKSVVIRAGEPLAAHTTIRVGGPADFWVEPASEADLAAILHYCLRHDIPMTLIGRGSNLLVKDGGIRGVVVNLRHPQFSRIEVRGERIVAGAGATLKQIAHAAKDAGLTGFEFMDGIPGSLGGALRMNAGAMGRATLDTVESLRCMDLQGNLFEVFRKDIDAHYRCCPLLNTSDGKIRNIALSAVLRGQKGDPEQIGQTLRLYEQKRRSSQPAAPSAGCIFKNPSPTLPAGRLIDELGFKGRQVGGARVSEKHANFIVTQPGARAADVLELIALIQQKAFAERNIRLETEVEILGQ